MVERCQYRTMLPDPLRDGVSWSSIWATLSTNTMEGAAAPTIPLFAG